MTAKKALTLPKKEEKKKKVKIIKVVPAKKALSKPVPKSIKVKVFPAKEKKVASVKGYDVPKKEIIIAPAEVCFWVNNGPALQSLLDLREAFKTLSADQYSYHANKDKNDFSTWTAHILKDEKCAKDLLKAKNMKVALKVVEQHLEEYAV